MKEIKRALSMTIVTIVLCGLLYPLTVTGISQVVFNKKANGSMIEEDGKLVGSALLGQRFDDERFFKGRISSINYNTFDKDEGQLPSSGATNYSTSNKELKMRVEKDIENFKKENPNINVSDLKEDIITQSASGLDPHLTPDSMKIQVPRVSKNTGISEEKINNILEKNIEGRELGVFGEKKINVLKVNLEIYKILKSNGKI